MLAVTTTLSWLDFLIIALIVLIVPLIMRKPK